MGRQSSKSANVRSNIEYSSVIHDTVLSVVIPTYNRRARRNYGTQKRPEESLEAPNRLFQESSITENPDTLNMAHH